MDFKKAEITEQVAQTTRDFAQQHIKPHVMEWDESQQFPLELFKQLGEKQNIFLVESEHNVDVFISSRHHLAQPVRYFLSSM